MPTLRARTLTSFLFLQCLVIAQGLLAYGNHILTVTQMRAIGINQGLPFLWHFGMWSDLIIISPLATYVISRHSDEWRIRSVAASLAIGIAIAAIMSWLYTFSSMPQAHVQNHHLTAAGIVHAVYMALAVAVFVQFLFFTAHVPVRSLQFASILLFVHVFIGTHMVLGIANAFLHFPWYPAHPLTSVFGWIIVVGVGAGLVWRNIGTCRVKAVCHAVTTVLFRASRWCVQKILFWLNLRMATTEGYLKLLNAASSLVAVGYFGHAIWRRLAPVSQMSDRHWLDLILISLFGLIFFFSRHSAKLEIDMGPELFPRDLVPNDLKPKERIEIALSVGGYLLLYIGLVRFVNDVVVITALMFLIASNDYRTRWLINKKMRQYLADRRYEPIVGEHDYGAIQERRRLAKIFLFEKPHLTKESARIAGCGLALCAAVLGHIYHLPWLIGLAYGVLIVTLIFNEILTLRWRLAFAQGFWAI